MTSAVAPADFDHLDALARVDHLVLVIAARGPHLPPSIFTQPTPSSLAIRSSTSAGLPTSAAAPVRIDGGSRRWRRATGRSVPNTIPDAATNTTRGQRRADAEQRDDRGKRRSERERRQVEGALVHLSQAQQTGHHQPDDPDLHTSRLPLAARTTLGIRAR